MCKIDKFASSSEAVKADRVEKTEEVSFSFLLVPKGRNGRLPQGLVSSHPHPLSVMDRKLLLLAIALLGLTCLQVATALTDAQRNAIVDWHNSYRRAEPANVMPDLVWDSKLEAVAQGYSDGCKWGHNGARGTQYVSQGGSGSVGENIAATWSSSVSFSVTQLMQGWADEKAHWSYPNTCEAGEECGHWTQMIWAGTTKVGCGLTTCNVLTNSGYTGSLRAQYIVCDYSTAGNNGNNPYVYRNPTAPSIHPAPSASVPTPVGGSTPTTGGGGSPPTTGGGSPPTTGGGASPTSVGSPSEEPSDTSSSNNPPSNQSSRLTASSSLFLLALALLAVAIF